MFSYQVPLDIDLHNIELVLPDILASEIKLNSYILGDRLLYKILPKNGNAISRSLKVLLKYNMRSLLSLIPFIHNSLRILFNIDLSLFHIASSLEVAPIIKTKLRQGAVN